MSEVAASKRKDEARKFCELHGHIPVDYEVQDPIYPRRSLGPRMMIFFGQWKQCYPCENCGDYLSEDEVEHE